MRRRITIGVFEPAICVTDVVTNRAYRSTHHQILYHYNFGYPLMSEGSFLKIDTGTYLEIENPSAKENTSETVEQFKLKPNAQGWCHATLSKTTLPLKAKLSFDSKTLPGFARWVVAEPGTYVTGLEPHSAQSNPNNKIKKSKNGHCWIEPGQSITYKVKTEFAKE